MKKLWIILNEVSKEEIEIENLFNDDEIEYEYVDLESFTDNTDVFSDIIIRHDSNAIKNPNFEAKIMQSSYDDVPTRLIIPDSFSSLDGWKKQYYLIHELGHYFSMQNPKIFGYYNLLEQKKLNSEIYLLPLEIEAEKYVKQVDFELLLSNFKNTYGEYYNQIKESIDSNVLTSSNIRHNFYGIFEIRLFRFGGILHSTLKGQPQFDEFNEKLTKTIELLNKLGAYARSLTAKTDMVITNSDFETSEVEEFLKIANNIKILAS